MDRASPCGNIEGVRIDPQAVREAREAKGINASELSRRMGRSRSYAHRIENGSRGINVSAQTLDGLASALGVEPGTLLLDPQTVSSATSPGPNPPPSTACAEEAPHPEAWRWG